MSSGSITVALIGGSVREGNYTMKALRLVAEELRSMPQVTVDLIDPAEFTIGFPGQAVDPTMQELQRRVSEATGVIVSTPEYHGGLSSVIKAVLENLGFPNALSGKPVALLGVAAGRIGAIKSLEQLRSICSHIGAIVLPGPISVAGVQKVFDEQGNCIDEAAGKQIRSLATHLVDYINDNLCPGICLEVLVRAGT